MSSSEKRSTSAGESHHAYAIERHSRYWRVVDPHGELVCLTVYKRGAREVIRRLCSGRVVKASQTPKEEDA
jgi:hypothetical protein